MTSSLFCPHVATDGMVVMTPPRFSHPPQAPFHQLWESSEEYPIRKMSILPGAQHVAAMAIALRPVAKSVEGAIVWRLVVLSMRFVREWALG